VLVIGLFMVLNQLKIAEEIVTVTFTVLMASLGLGLALAFGLGGRGVAGRLLEDAYDKGREQRGQVKHDMERGKERAQAEAERGRQRIEVDGGNFAGGAPSPGSTTA
jgi:hypothetical protein